MTTIDSRPDVSGAAGDSAVERTLTAVADWLTASDHKKIGRLMISAGLLGFLITVVVNVMISVERIDGGDSVLDSGSWTQLLGAQSVGLVFGTALPLASGLAIAMVPLQLGARALAHPRVAAAGMYLWLGGFILSTISLLQNGGIGGGNPDMVAMFLAAHGLMALGFTAIGVSLVTSVLTTRAPGMTMRRVPFFTFSALVYGIGLVLVMPVFFGTIIYLFVDHRSGAREAFGGNEGIATWAGWMFTQPATYLVAIPALGLFAELVPVTFRKRMPMRGVTLAGIGLLGVAALGAVTQQNEFSLPWPESDFALGDLLTWGVFMVLPLLGAALLFVSMALVAKPEKSDDDSDGGSRINATAGLLFAFFGFGMVLVGMAGGAIAPISDLDLQGTVFGEAALVYITYGTALGVIGGIVYWSPKMSGHVLDMKKVAPLALLGVLGVVLAAFPQYIAGFLDQPAGVQYENGDLQIWNILSLVGHGLMGLTLLAFLGLLAATVIADEPDAGDDPFEGQTIEWATTSPAPDDNFVDVPMINSAEPMLDLRSADTTGSAS